MKIICQYCNKQAKLHTGEKLYPHRPDLYHLRFWMCEPCGAYVGTHKNNSNTPLGRLANAELRRLKVLAHEAFDPLWKKGNMSRTSAYIWLSMKLKIDKEECHIGMFDEKICKKVIEICTKELLKCHNFNK